MKELKRLKLTHLSQVELEKKELSQLLGGYACCQCNCATSATTSNTSMNDAQGYHTSDGTGAVNYSF